MTVATARHHPWLLALRALLVAGLLALAVSQHGERLVQWMLPGLASALAWLAPDFELLSVTLVDDRGNRALQVQAMLSRVLLEGTQVVVPDGLSRLRLTTTVGNVLQPLLTALLLALAWPLRRGLRLGLTDALLRLALLAPLLALAVVLDTVLSLAGRLWHTTLKAHGIAHDSLLLDWIAGLNGGGRLALGLVMAGLAIGLAQAWAPVLLQAFMPRARPVPLTP